MATPSISYQPYHIGDTYPTWEIPLNTDAGPDNLTGVSASNISLYFRNTTVNPPTDTIGTGTLTINSTNPAEIYYKPSTTDVASPFTGQIVIKVQFPPSHSSADEAVFDGIPFIISY